MSTATEKMVVGSKQAWARAHRLAALFASKFGDDAVSVMQIRQFFANADPALVQQVDKQKRFRGAFLLQLRKQIGLNCPADDLPAVKVSRTKLRAATKPALPASFADTLLAVNQLAKTHGGLDAVRDAVSCLKSILES